MEKLTLKHLAPYLPYKLNVKTFKKVKELNETVLLAYSNDLNLLKPILRPLSDLTKEIEVDGEKFIPFIELAKIELGEVSSNELSNKIEENDYSLEIELLPSWFTLYFYKKSVTFTRYDDGDGMNSCSNNLLFKLFEWHFDVFGLIEKNLAININTL